MAEMQSARRSVKALVGEGFSVARQCLASMIPIYLVFTVVSVVKFGYESVEPKVNHMHDPAQIEVLMLLQVLAGIAYFWTLFAAMSAAARQVNGRPLSTAKLASTGARRFFPGLIATVLAAIVVLIGFLLLIVPGLYLSVRLYLIPYLVGGEGYGPIAGFNKSAELVKGHWWHTCGAVALVTVIPLVVYLLLLLLAVLGGMGAALVQGVDAAHAHATLSPTMRFISEICVFAIELFGIQLSAGVAAVLTADLRARHSDSPDDFSTAMQA